MVPRLSELIILLTADRALFTRQIASSVETAAREFGLAAKFVLVASAPDLNAALRPNGSAGVSAAYVFGFGSSIAPKEIADTALRNRVPTMFEYSEYVEAGGLMSYRLNWENQTRRTAAQLDKVFRGVRPAQIPFELPTRSELAINKSTARSLGLMIPQSLLLRADRVFE
jgi:putative ABC transport system substrate-binding protein